MLAGLVGIFSRDTGKMRNAENRERVKCGILHVEKYCGTADLIIRIIRKCRM